MKYSKYQLVLKKEKVHDVSKEYNINSSVDAYEFATKVMKLHQMPEEHFCMISVSSTGDIIGYTEVSRGSLCSSEAHPREVYKTAIVQNSAAILCFHNHPSGDPSPSDQDIRTTKRLARAGEILGIKLLDHIIIGDGQFVSMQANGYMD